MDELIEHMKLCGWTEDADGSVSCEGCATYPTWMEAIKGCIEVASDA